MQKKIIALAIAGLASSAAFAQSNVTIYGVADGSFEFVSAGGVTANGNPTSRYDFASRNRVNSNNSLIGFKGAESLGGGLTAVFQFETNVNLGGVNGAATPYAAGALIGSQRDTFIGLAGGFGTVAAGYLSTPTRSTLVQFDVMPGATGAGGINTLIGRVNVGAAAAPLATATGYTTGNTFSTTVMNANTVFRTTAIAYITPNLNGFTGTLAYVPNSGKDSVAGSTTGNTAPVAGAAERAPSAWNLSLNYAAGPLKVGYAYLKATDADLLNIGATVAPAGGYTGASSLKTHILGASYNFGNGFTMSAVYDKVTADLGNSAAATTATVSSVSRNGWYLGAKFVTGPHEIAGAYSRMGDNSVTCASTGCLATSNYGNSGAHQIALRYGYNLSKRTQLYGLYTRVTNDSNGNFDVFNGSGLSAAASTFGAGADPQVWGAGMRHSF